jgi:hypothetical protein
MQKKRVSIKLIATLVWTMADQKYIGVRSWKLYTYTWSIKVSDTNLTDIVPHMYSELKIMDMAAVRKYGPHRFWI